MTKRCMDATFLQMAEDMAAVLEGPETETHRKSRNPYVIGPGYRPPPAHLSESCHAEDLRAGGATTPRMETISPTGHRSNSYQSLQIKDLPRSPSIICPTLASSALFLRFRMDTPILTPLHPPT